jgi:phosphoribosylformylglycinamidine synthase subunit PurL
LLPIHPTPVVGMVGLVADLGRLCGLGWRRAGDAIWLLGVAPLEAAGAPDPRLGLAGSSYLEVIHGAVTGRPPEVDLALEGAVQALLRRAIAAGLLASAHDLSDGGLAVALAECCIAAGLGAGIDLPASAVRPDRLLFAEGGARVVVSVAPEDAAAWAAALERAGVPATALGVVADDGQLAVALAGQLLLRQPVEQLATAWEEAIPRRLGQAPPPLQM